MNSAYWQTIHTISGQVWAYTDSAQSPGPIGWITSPDNKSFHAFFCNGHRRSEMDTQTLDEAKAFIEGQLS